MSRVGDDADCKMNSKSWKHWRTLSDMGESYEMFIVTILTLNLALLLKDTLKLIWIFFKYKVLWGFFSSVFPLKVERATLGTHVSCLFWQQIYSKVIYLLRVNALIKMVKGAPLTSCKELWLLYGIHLWIMKENFCV